MIATHIVWTTFGTWLPGDERGWVPDHEWRVHPPNPVLYAVARSRMIGQAVELSMEQRNLVEHTIRDHCRIRDWKLHALHVGSRHVHIVVSGDQPPRRMRDQFKAWCSRRLSDAAGLTEKIAKGAGRKKWFTEGGDTEFIDDEQRLANAVRYVMEGQ